jgi:serine/threonine protein kinase
MTPGDEAPARSTHVPKPSSVLPEKTLVAGRYRLGRVLGWGASGTVYAATDVSADGGPPEVALKIIHRHLCKDAHMVARFDRERRILERATEHVGNGVAKLFSCVEHDGLVALVLERIDAPSLEQLLERGPVSIDAAVRVARLVSETLVEAHAAGIVHRDLKPANVLIEGAGDGALTTPPERVRLLDFGLGKVLHGEPTTGLTSQDMIVGTPEYMAPEQARGDESLDERCDVYALGVMLYEMLVGRPPYTGGSAMAVLSRHLDGALVPPRRAAPERAIPAAVEAIVVKALARAPEERLRTSDLRDALEAVEAHGGVTVGRRSFVGGDLADTDLSLPEPAGAERAPLDAGERVVVGAEASAGDAGKLGFMRTLKARASDDAWRLPPPPATPAPGGSSSVVATSADDLRRSRRPEADPERSRAFVWLAAAVVVLAVVVGAVLGAR